MDWTLVGGLVAGLLIATVTAPVGVSGAVFLLPVQLSVLGVPNPAVTPTNLLYNVVAGPGALWRYRHDGALRGGLARRLVLGTLPGVVLGSVVRVFVLPGPDVFRLLIATLLLPLGVWLCLRTVTPGRHQPSPAGDLSEPALTGLALAVGVIGGIYGIGGGSILGPVLVGRGMPVDRPAGRGGRPRSRVRQRRRAARAVRTPPGSSPTLVPPRLQPHRSARGLSRTARVTPRPAASSTSSSAE
ncbi:TSUP family transporter [Streptomyces sp. NPDC002779]|uniref:TSUP family transporter n=1 Tax=Streptomyces sp. NPDC002779 TaxID=3364664 RepID=UPI0036A2D902